MQPGVSLLDGRAAAAADETGAPRASRAPLFLALLFSLAWFAATRFWWTPVHGGADANAYLVGAWNLRATGDAGQRPRDPDTGKPDSFAFVSTMLVGVDLGSPDERYYPYYPIGMLSAYAAAMRIGGDEHALTAAYLLNPLAMAAGLFGVFLFSRHFLAPWPALLATFLVGISPTVLHLANNTRSHGLSFALAVFSTLLLLRVWRTGAWPAALAAGALLGAVVTVRYGAAFLGAPAALVLAFVLREQRPLRRSLTAALALAAGGAIPVAWLLATNVRTMGMVTAYDSTGASTAFGFASLVSKSVRSAGQLWSYGLFLLLPLGLVGLVRLLVVRRRAGLFLASILLPGWLLMASYYWDSVRRPYNTTRFYLELMPAFAVCALTLFESRPGEIARRRILRHSGLALVSLATTAQFVAAFAPALVHLRQSQSDMLRRVEIVREKVPEGSLLFGSDVTLFHGLQPGGPCRLYANRTFDPPRRNRADDSEETLNRDPAREARLEQAAREAGTTVLAMRDVILRAALARQRPVFVVSISADDLAAFEPYALVPVAEHSAPRPSPANWAVGPKPSARWHLYRVEGLE